MPAWYGQNYYCIECEVRYASKHTCKPVRICSKCSETNCLLLPTFTRCCKKCFGLFVIVPVSEITCQTVCVTIQSHVTQVASGSLVQCLNAYAIYHIAVIVQNLSNQITSGFFRWKSDPMSSRRNMFSTTLSVLKTRLTLKQNDPFTKLIIVLLLLCDIYPDNGLCDDCLPVHTFSGLCGQNGLEKCCKWAFDHPVNEGAVFIAHNSSNYDAHFLLSYLITNGECPEILTNGGKLLEMKTKTSNAKLIDSSMPFSRFSDTFNIPHTKGTFPHMFNVSENYNYVGPLPALRYYHPNRMKEPLRTLLIE